MLKQTFFNAIVSGGAQAISLAVLIALASTLDVELFGALSVQLSVAAVTSILCTFQFERIYVRVRAISLAAYIGFHLRCFLLITIVFFGTSLPFKNGPTSIALAAAISLAQISFYVAARQRRFRVIWLMKMVQALMLLLAVATVYASGQYKLFWFAFFVSYGSAGLFVLDKATLKAVVENRLRDDLRRFRYSVRIAAMAMGSLMAGSFTREFPVILSGAIGQPETAGALGLVMRTVGAPVGLLARSASAVVAGYVATNQFDKRSLVQLLAIPALGGVYIGMLAFASLHIDAFDKYSRFTLFLALLTPLFLVRAYIGLLGPAVVYFRLQFADFLCNTILALTAAVIGVFVYTGFSDVVFLLTSVSGVSALLGAVLIERLVKHAGTS